jgi:diacylglycerol kinase (ATP)
MHTLESIVLALKSGRIKKLDVGMVTSSTGDRIFLESIGIGLLAESMIEMRALEKKNRFKIRLSSEERLTLALKNLDRMAKNYPEADCQLVLDDEIVAGTFLLLEIANMSFIGPNLQLFPRPDPSDGQLDIVWIKGEQRSQWQEYAHDGWRDRRRVRIRARWHWRRSRKWRRGPWRLWLRKRCVECAT